MTVPPNSTSMEKEVLLGKLDILLERYLILLDDYQTTRSILSDRFAKGSLSIARANFSNQARVRYGQGLYDQRMQALARVNIEDNGNIKITHRRLHVSKHETAAVHSGKSDDDKSKEISNDKADPDADPEPSSTSNDDLEGSSISFRDPLKWFGMGPQSLRDAQGSFQEVVMNNIPTLLNVMRQMAETEIEVRRTRKKISKLVGD